MTYGLLADLVLLLHLVFVLFVSLGGLLALRWRGFIWLHLPAAAWGTFVEVAGRICPLTPLENRFRRAAGGAGYEGDFIEHYLTPLVYPPGLTRATQVGLGVLVIIINTAIYTALWRRGQLTPARLRRRGPPRRGRRP